MNQLIFRYLSRILGGVVLLTKALYATETPRDVSTANLPLTMDKLPAQIGPFVNGDEVVEDKKYEFELYLTRLSGLNNTPSHSLPPQTLNRLWYLFYLVNPDLCLPQWKLKFGDKFSVEGNFSANDLGVEGQGTDGYSQGALKKLDSYFHKMLIEDKTEIGQRFSFSCLLGHIYAWHQNLVREITELDIMASDAEQEKIFIKYMANDPLFLEYNDFMKTIPQNEIESLDLVILDKKFNVFLATYGKID